MYEDETIIYKILEKFSALHFIKYFELKRQLITMIGILNVIIVVLVSIFPTPLSIRIISKLILFLPIIYLFINCNFYIFKYSIRSFEVLYKMIHAFIASIAVYMLYFPNDETIIKMKQNDTYVPYKINRAMFGVTNVAFVMMASLLDGYATRNDKSIKILKYIILVTGILYYVWQWCLIYFHLSDQYIENYDKLLTLHIFGHNDSFLYRSMALSSYSKVVFFFCVQLYRHFKHPNRINTIPALVAIKQSNFNETDLQIQMQNHSKCDN